MKLILSPKDTLGKMTLTDVSGFALEGKTLLVVFESGRTRNYPLEHLWYYESHVEYHRADPLVDTNPSLDQLLSEINEPMDNLEPDNG